MNELEIKQKVDKLIQQSESHLEEIFARMLNEVLKELNRMYTKYSVQGKEPSWTDVNKYNRLHNILNRITEILTDEYKEVVKEIEQLEKNTYLETFLQEAYLIEVFEATDMGFTIPTQKAIEAALANPIEFLTLPKILQEHRNQITRQLQTLITQNLLRGDGYYTLATEIQKTVGFHRKKAVMVARTEAGRAMSIADEEVYEQASKYTKIEKVWCSALDLRVRMAHRKLDGQKADEEGYFHYRGMKAKRPHGWHRADMDINCRCVVLKIVNGMYPSVRRGRNYRDEAYQAKLQKAIKEYQKKEKLSYAQAFNRAFARIQPPNEIVPYMTYEEWYQTKSGQVS